MCDKRCNCENQIVWFFNDQPTVIVCKKCEIAVHYAEDVCPKCGGKLTSFIQDGFDEDEEFETEEEELKEK